MVLSSKPAVAAVDRRDRQADERKYAGRYTDHALCGQRQQETS